MIDYFNDTEEMLMTCDGDDCSEFVELLGSWNECISEAKGEGWGVVKDDLENTYQHFCPRCWANRKAGGIFA